MPKNLEHGTAADPGEGNGGGAVILKTAATREDLEIVRALVREYMEYLSVDLSFQDIAAELAGLPGKYAPPGGALLLAWRTSARDTQEAAGCVALRDLGDGVCEMKRLFVRPEYRGCGIGKALADRAVLEARRLGYAKMRLDTLDRLTQAVGLYRSMGFCEISPYCENPLPGALFWEKRIG